MSTLSTRLSKLEGNEANLDQVVIVITVNTESKSYAEVENECDQKTAERKAEMIASGELDDTKEIHVIVQLIVEPGSQYLFESNQRKSNVQRR